LSDCIKKLRTKDDDKSDGNSGKKRKRGHCVAPTSQTTTTVKMRRTAQTEKRVKQLVSIATSGTLHTVPDSQRWTLEQNKAKKPLESRLKAAKIPQSQIPKRDT
jgi:hypothetical protein